MRGGFVRDAFHQIAVAAQGVDVDNRTVEAGLVEVGGQPARGDGHADAVAAALAERAGRGFDAAGFHRLRDGPGQRLPSWRNCLIWSSGTASSPVGLPS